MGSHAVWVLSLVVMAGTCGSSFAEVKCSVDTWSSGILSTFGEETASIKLPCRYLMAQFSCSHYRVKVVPGNTVNMTSKNVPLSTLWVKVVDTNSGNFVAVHTSIKRIERYHRDRVDNPWEVKKGDASLLSDLGYKGHLSSVFLEVKDTFQVSYNEQTELVSARCYLDRETLFRGSPSSLCGDGKTHNALELAAKEMFPDESDVNKAKDYYTHYFVMNQDSIFQREYCAAMAGQFKRCDAEKKPAAAEKCHQVFTDVSTFGKQTQTLEDVVDNYIQCLSEIC